MDSTGSEAWGAEIQSIRLRPGKVKWGSWGLLRVGGGVHVFAVRARRRNGRGNDWVALRRVCRVECGEHFAGAGCVRDVALLLRKRE